MKIRSTVLLLVFLALPITAQKKDSTILNKWIPSAVAGFNISQLALSNWSQGGENSLTWTLTGDFSYNYQGNDIEVKNNLRLAYGRTKLGSEDFKTNNNDFYLESVILKKIDFPVDPYFSNTVRTSLTIGYNYGTTPKTEIVNFFDPGYVTQSIGFYYEPNKEFNTRLGIGVEEVFTRNNTKYADNKSTPRIEKSGVEAGIESVSSLKKLVAENLLLKSKLRLFTRFNSLDVWDVRWDNTIVAKINGFLNVNFTFLLVYQQDQSLKTQIKQGLQLGFVYTIL
ncbi:MAG TPA: DUF3078 domain-containing protein [Ignavibacteria bacterium]|nr:DUF3078 domain-containing protein [Ignavibacteria bacterium]